MTTTPTTPDIFDQLAQPQTQPAQGAQTGPVAPVTASQPQPTQTAPQGQGDIFDQLSSGNASPSAVASPSSSQPNVPTMVSATPDEGFADKVKNWASNVTSDLRHGTDLTGVGSVLKALGAHGLDAGVSPGVAEFMGSLPLGLLKATKGAAEVTQPGQRWQGTKDVVGGALDASTLPGAFVSPEAGELAGVGSDTTLTQAANAAKAVGGKLSKTFDTHSIQAPLQQGVRNVLDTVARDAGVTPSPSASIRDVASSVADAVIARSKGLYAQLDAATGGNVSRFEQAARNVNQKLREVAGLDDENEAALVQRKAEIEKAQEEAFAQAKAAGVDPVAVDKARADWKQAQSLYDLDSQLKMSASGMRPELAGTNNSPEVLDPRKAFERLNKLYNSGRLQQAVGQSQSEQIIQHADAAFLQQQKILARQKTLKTVGKVTGTGAAIGALGEGAKTLFGHQ
jgi:hypothetical protein